MAPQNNGSDIIVMSDMRKRFGRNVVLSGVDLRLAAGDTLAILGASGSGKSVLVSMIVGLVTPDEGRIWVDGTEVTRLKRELDWYSIRLKIGFLFQGSALFDSMTVGENVAFPLVHHTHLSRQEIMKKVCEKLNLVGLEGQENKMPAELSGGMQKRAALARAIAHDPKIVIFDEPTTGLDPIRSDSIARLIRKLRTELEISSIVVTHDMNCAYTAADRMILIHNGKIIARGDADSFRNSQDPAVRQFVTGSSEGPLT